ncbi:Holliday junction resolvase RecU [Mycoplasmopsis phocirhinis]|uniref:Holliday junction resolvase RecU n=1 Tax=Mycoplasmopsis phocirhinis TaxID=142650 RepID=A0A4P6MQP4_9BACT|nr:Holliday junction resolvase RecU [Mycoplasmopsis phocirhinis]QBF34389.1 Holliday junction resolvase RecU [Mycoplasmopsis phocirhinis]
MNKNRGMLLEKIINQTILYYEKNGLAVIEKKTLPIKFQKMNSNKQVSGAFVFKKSTVDYIGCYNGSFIAFEAKTTNENRLPSSNISPHQIQYLSKISSLGGISFFIIFFSQWDEFYLISAKYLLEHWKKSWTYEEIKNAGYSIELSYPGIIDFLPYIDNLFS